MAGRLQDRVALVSGGAQGIGEAIARRFAEEGARVVIGDVRREQGQATAKEIGGLFVDLDVTQPAQWAAATAEVEARLGGLAILVNNAGVSGGVGQLVDESEEVHRRVLDVNLTGVWAGMRAAIPLMARGGGAIVNISSIDGLVGVAGMSTYAATKFAVTGYTRSLALEVGQLGIRVNAVHPGIIATPLVASASEKVHARLQRALDRQAIPRMGRPQEIANAALFLASDEASYVTGASLVVDGGHIAGPFREPAE